MSEAIIPREEVAQQLSIAVGTLLRYESQGLVAATREGSVEGYSRSDIRRVWTIVSLQRDLGVNLAGVDAVLRLRDHLRRLEADLILARIELSRYTGESLDE